MALTPDPFEFSQRPGDQTCVASSIEQALGTDSRGSLNSMYAEAAAKQGYSMEDAVLYLRGRGIAPNAQFQKSISLDELEQIAQTGKPVIVEVGGTDPTGKIGHAVVIERIEDGKFWVSDPLTGPYLQTPADFAQRLKGYGQAITNLR